MVGIVLEHGRSRGRDDAAAALVIGFAGQGVRFGDVTHQEGALTGRSLFYHLGLVQVETRTGAVIAPPPKKKNHLLDVNAFFFSSYLCSRLTCFCCTLGGTNPIFDLRCR